MKRNMLKSTILLSTTVLSMATVTVFADEELAPTAEVTEVVDNVDNATENSEAAIIETSNDMPENQSQEIEEISSETLEQSSVAESAEAMEKPVSDTSDEPKSPEITIPQYEENVADFNQVPMTDVYTMFTEDGKEHVIYVGRPTCYYCRQFSPALKTFNMLMGNGLAYYNTDGQDFDEAAANFLFETVGIPGTPTLIRLQNGRVVSAWIGGGISGQELYDYLFYGKKPAAMTAPSTEGNTEESESEDKEIEDEPNIQHVVSFSQNDAKATEKTSVASENRLAFSKNEIKPTNSTTLPKLGVKTNNFSAYGLLMSLLGLILMVLGKGKFNMLQ